jgi:cytochrome P450
MDAPEHTRLRRLVNRVFHPGAVEALRPAVEHAAAELLDQIPADEPFDVVTALAEPLPVAALAPLLGVGSNDGTHAMAALATIENVRTAPGVAPSAIRASERALAQVENLLGSDSSGGESLLSVLQAAESETEIDRHEAASLLAHIGTVGLAPTSGLIGNGLYALFENPDELETLRRDPSLIPGAVHEFMRYDSPIHAVPRLATHDTELLGRKIRAGEPVFVVAAAANRDPAVFDDPDRLDVRRDARLHLGFGMGPHICLGGPLARMVAEVSFQALIERFPRLRLHGTPERAPGFERRMFSKLVVKP